MYALEPAPEQALNVRRFAMAVTLTTLMFSVAHVVGAALSDSPRLPRAPRVALTLVHLAPPAVESLKEKSPKVEQRESVVPPRHPVNKAAQAAPPVQRVAEVDAAPSPSDAALPAESVSEPASVPPVFIAGLTLAGGTQLAGVAGGGGQAAREGSVTSAAPGRSARSHTASVRRRGSEPAVAATLLSSVSPEYSLEATRAGVEGLVILVIDIDSQGRVRDARVIRGLGHGLDQAAVRAAKQTVWQPGLLDGAPAPTTRRFSVRFNLRS